MTITAPPSPSRAVTGWRDRSAPLARRAALAASVVLGLGLAMQLVSAGAAVFVNPEWWLFHAEAVHWFDWLSPVAIVLGFLGRLSRRFKVLSVSVVVLVFLQYFTAGLRTSASFGAGAALHPLNGFLLFWAVTEMLRCAWAQRRG
ncbi:MAG: DUF6220 domain-containing protein [Betaproteobacteria bacterium]